MNVFAHRGASADAPENTLRAFRLAREQGADGVELDVMRCATGEVVVFHDDDLARLGGGTAHDRVRAMSWDALRERDIGGERIPLLSQVLEETAPMLVNVELKSPPTWAARARDDGLAVTVAELLAHHGAEKRALVSSFDPLLLLRFRRTASSVPIALLFGHEQSRPLRDAWSAPLLRPEALHPEAALVDALALRRWRDGGRRINVWTVDDPAELRWLAALGVDGVITNRPRDARLVLTSR
jgi:glycerophosphoryl diester phosphodiesterase